MSNFDEMDEGEVQESGSVVETIDKDHAGELRLRFGNARQALIVKECMEVDGELQPLRVTKTFHISPSEANILVVNFTACDLKMLRVAISSFFDMVTVSCKTLLEFDDEVEE